MGLDWDVSFYIFLRFLLFFGVVYAEGFLQSLGLGTSRRRGVDHLGIRHSDTK